MDDVEFLSILNDTDDGLGPADGYAATIEYAEALIVDRDRMGPVVTAAVEYVEAQVAWRQRLESGRLVRSTDDVARRRAAAIATLVAAVEHFYATGGL